MEAVHVQDVQNDFVDIFGLQIVDFGPVFVNIVHVAEEAEDVLFLPVQAVDLGAVDVVQLHVVDNSESEDVLDALAFLDVDAYCGPLGPSHLVLHVLFQLMEYLFEL